MRRLTSAVALALALALTAAGPAAAHTGFEPDEVAPGSIVAMTLRAADERDTASMTRVELVLPEGVTIPVADAATAAPGWTASATAERVTWEGPAAEGDQRFTFTLGPLPPEPQRLQFKVLQTYDDGDVDRWIEDWPAGAPEPATPGPVLDLVPGAPGTIPDTTVAPPTTTSRTTSDDTVVALDDPVVAAPDTTAPTDDGDAAAGDDGDDDGSSLGGPLAIGAVLLVLGALAIWFSRRSRP
jgi:uncharacterized protein YcnI